MIPKKPFIPALATAILLTVSQSVTAHGNREKRPATVGEAFIPITGEETFRAPEYRHPPGNVRAEDMRALFGNTVMVVDSSRKYGDTGTPDHALKVIFLGRAGRYAWCAYGEGFKYFFADHIWAPMKVKHDGQLWHRLDANINNEKWNGHSPLYDGATGRIIMYARTKKHWHDWDLGHLQERLPRAVWTLCPDFPSAEELGVGVNEAQTAITYDKLIAQDPGRRILRPDLITPDPTEVIE